MNSREHGDGFFYWYVHGNHDYLDVVMKSDCQNINDDYDFFDFVFAHNGGYASRDEFLAWFHSIWRFIPKSMLYQTYKELLDNTNWAQGRWAHSYFFKPDLRNDIMTLNKHDTVKNPALRSLLNEDGYLTVYHSRCKETMHNAYSWLLNKNMAIEIGHIDATVFSKRPHFYCVTGKIRLEDVITFISGHSTHEITVMPQMVKSKTKELFNVNDAKKLICGESAAQA